MDWGWVSNPWFVGVVGSIPGGFLVNWLTGLVLGRRENREYLQKINGANREIVYAIRPGISEGQIPTADVLSSLINATARRYSVEASDLYTPAQISEELVKEVMDSSFISSVQKADFCSRLTELSGKSKAIERTETVKEVQPRTAAEYRQRLISAISMMLGVMTALMTVTYSFYDIIRTKKMDSVLSANDKSLEPFIPLLTALVTVMTALLGMMLYRDVLRRKRDAEYIRAAAVRFEGKPRTVKRPKPPETEA